MNAPDTFRQPGNAVAAAQLAHAQAALDYLDAAGAIVLAVHLGGSGPSIEIDAPPRFVSGALAARSTVHGIRKTTRVARVRGCTVSWIERVDVGMARASR